jgi:hypothetical protein
MGGIIQLAKGRWGNLIVSTSWFHDNLLNIDT